MSEPLTPADCDLRGMAWMPLFGHRLFASDFDARATDTEFRCAIRLWWAAWQQVPAASLPDEDRVLCHLSGLGRDMKTWLKVKASALHGFIKCSDGRLYHKALSAEALEAWDRRVKERTRKASWRARRNGPGDGDGGEDETPSPNGTRPGQDADGDGDTTRTSPLTRQDRTRQDLREEDSSSLRSEAPDEPAHDVRTELFRSGLSDLRSLTGQADGQSRRLIGLLLRDARDDAARVLTAIQQARDLRPAEPIAWLKAACKPRQTIAHALLSGAELDFDADPIAEFDRVTRPEPEAHRELAEIAHDPRRRER